MKLYYSPTSPYTRKCLIVAHEVGLADRLQIIQVSTAPTTPSQELLRHNPLCKLPTLLLDDASALYDSRVICEYLDDLGSGGLLPKQGAARWQVLARQALAEGILDAALSARYEAVLRPAEFRWEAWSEGQLAKIHSTLAQFEHQADSLAQRVDLGTIGLACALAYLDLRFPELDWHTVNPRLGSWFNAFEQRPSMRKTQFQA
ncbi:glutathione S-transferase [Castellaniella sp. GW247-6E4]|uniref:glutathione S-transferase n=1 Tax=Castellaniella sp. GW247-6E4 TaxID=3140380 RepID=UPI003315C1D5